MWQRFTERARRAIFFAQEEAGRLGENYVGTEHILLGLVRESNHTATQVLARLGVGSERIKSELEARLSRGQGAEGKDMQLTLRAKRVIDLAYDEARVLTNGYIGTEHLLLGLIRERESVAGQLLAELGADLEAARREVRRVQHGAASEEPSRGGQQAAEASTDTSRDKEALKAVKQAVGYREPGVRHIPASTSLKGQDLLSIAELSAEEIDLILSTADLLKSNRVGRQQQLSILEGRTLAMLFEKPSLRTRVTFEVGMTQLGGHSIYLQPSDIKMGEREPIKDVASNLARWVDCIMARTFKHETVTELAEHSRVPVINGLSDFEHPCQALADFLTIKEKKGRLRDLKLAYIGDGNNVAHSLMFLAAKMGTHIFLACPEGYEPNPEVTERARTFAAETGTQIEIVRKPEVAAADADVLYTDVWTSMGQETETAERRKAFQGYQINGELLKGAKEDAIVLHCLPAHRGEEITDEVIDGPQSVVLDEAENRLHAQKAVLTLVI